MKYDFVVIGAGMSGLTAAIILAQNGYQVAIVEKAPQISPLLRGFSRKGVHFDTGFHYTGGLGSGETLDIIFRYLGLADQLTTYNFRENGFDIFRSIKDKFEFHFPVGYDLIREKLIAEFPAERAAIDRYLQQVRSICSSLPYLNLDVGVNVSSFMLGLDNTTLQETLDALTGNKTLKALLSMHCALYGVAPNEVRFSQHASIVGSYYQSAMGLRGGGLSLVNAFDVRLKALGIDVFCGSSVTGISVSPQGDVCGITLESGVNLATTGCVATVNPVTMLDMLPEEVFRPAYRKRLRGLKETVSAYMIYAASDQPIPILAGTNLFIFPDGESLNNLGKGAIEDNLLYLAGAYSGAGNIPTGFIGISPTLFENTAAWHHSLTGKRPADYRTFKDEVLLRFKTHIDSFCPELAGSMQYTEAATPLTVRDFNNTPRGGLYGIKHMSGQFNPFPITKVKGLFLAGQAILSPGIMGAALSAVMACGSILGHEHLRKELKSCS